MKYKPTIKEESDIPDIISDDYFSAVSLKSAVWQYLIDHSQVVDDEKLLKIYLYIPSEKEFWRRVKARENGTYKRNDLADLKSREDKKLRAVQRLRIENNKFKEVENQNRVWNARIQKKEEKGNLYERLALKIAKIMRKWARDITKKILIKSK